MYHSMTHKYCIFQIQTTWFNLLHPSVHTIHLTATVYEHFCFRMKNTKVEGWADSNGEVGTKKKTDQKKKRARERKRERERGTRSHDKLYKKIKHTASSSLKN